MEPPLDAVETELIPNQIIVFDEDLSNWTNIAPEYVGPPDAQMRRIQLPTVQPAPAKSADQPTTPNPAPTKSV